MSQRSTCGMRRFDKHKICADTRVVTTEHSTELQQRLRQREEQDKALFGTSPAISPAILSSSPVSIPPPPSPVLAALLSPPVLSPPVLPSNLSGYTPWKTPSASISTTAFEPRK